MVIAFKNVGQFNQQFKQYLWDIIDILVQETRLRMLQGERLLVMLYSPDNIDIDAVGAVSVAECFLKSAPNSDGKIGW